MARARVADLRVSRPRVHEKRIGTPGHASSLQILTQHRSGAGSSVARTRSSPHACSIGADEIEIHAAHEIGMLFGQNVERAICHDNRAVPRARLIAVLAGIIVNLAMIGGYWDILMRDVALCLLALSFARLARAFPVGAGSDRVAVALHRLLAR